MEIASPHFPPRTVLDIDYRCSLCGGEPVFDGIGGEWCPTCSSASHLAPVEKLYRLINPDAEPGGGTVIWQTWYHCRLCNEPVSASRFGGPPLCGRCHGSEFVVAVESCYRLVEIAL